MGTLKTPSGHRIFKYLHLHSVKIYGKCERILRVYYNSINRKED